MTKSELLASARANLAPALRAIRPSPESLAIKNVIEALEKPEASAPKAAPLKRVALGKAAK